MIALQNDARACAIFLYTDLAVHHLAGADAEILRLLTVQSPFWRATLGAMQSATFVALGRLYDDDPGVHSATAMLAFASRYLGLFSRPSLTARKIREGLSPTQAAAFVAGAFIPGQGALQHLVDTYEANGISYRDRVKPIRDQVFAHADRISPGERDALFEVVMVRDFERLAVFPLQLWDALFQLYRNGRKPDLRPAPTDIQEIAKDLPGTGAASWEHRHAVDNLGVP